MNIVQRVPTPVTDTEALRIMSQDWPTVFSEAPVPDALALVLALVWIETARGTRCFNNNLLNISAGDQWPNDAWRPPWFDFDAGTNVTERNIKLHELMLQGKAPKAFRSYPSLDAGALDGLRTLKGHYPSVVAAAKTGSADKFRVALSQLFSADYSNVHATDTLATFQNQFLATMGEPAKPEQPIEAPGLGRGVGLVLALGLGAAAVGLFVATMHPPRVLMTRAA